MKIELHKIPVRDLVKGYQDNAEAGGVVGYDGKLDIRPPYQREFVYKDHQRDAVIQTVNRGFPLNIMYWMVRDDGTFEVLDGQQRTISLAQYVGGEFSIDKRYFHNLADDEQDRILDYELMVYFCEGSDSERLDWFRTVNIAGERLYEQELRNAVYAGPWLSAAKPIFSKSQCPAFMLSSERGHLMSGSPIRQEYLETVLRWISKGNIEDYMGKHQHDKDADEIWTYYKAVVGWVRKLFPHHRKEMKGVAWGDLYNVYKDGNFDSDTIEAEVRKLMVDEDVTAKKGIYPFILTRNEKYLSIRAFSPEMRREAYERQNGICVKCKEHFKLEEMEADHIKPWHEGGRTDAANCQMLCKADNRAKGGK